MMNVNSPKLLVISETAQTDETEEEEVKFQHHVTPHEKLLRALSAFFTRVLSVLQLIGGCLCRGRRRGCVPGAESTTSDGGVGRAEEEGRSLVHSRGSLNHTPIRAEPEVTSEVLRMEMEAATPLPGENMTTPPEKSGELAPLEVIQEVNPSPLPTAHSPLQLDQ